MVKPAIGEQVLDARGHEIHVGDLIMQGMRPGDPHGWGDPVRVVIAMSGEWLCEDTKTGEREEMQGDNRLRALIERWNRTKP